MKRLLILASALALFLITNQANAQRGKINFGLNAATSSPLGDNSNVYKAGWGFDGSLDYYFGQHFDMGIESGLRKMNYKAENQSDDHLSVVPVLLTLGLHNDIGEIVDLYGELGGGTYFMSSTLNSETNNYGGLSPRIGIAIDLSNNWFLDTAVDYTHIFNDGTDMNWVGVKFGLLYTIN